MTAPTDAPPAAPATIPWRCDPHGALVAESAGWAAYTGMASTEYLGWGWLAALHPDDVGPTAAAWRQCLERRIPLDVTYRLRRADGTWGRVRSHGAPVVDDDGEVTAWVGMCVELPDAPDADDLARQAAAVDAARAAADAERARAANVLEQMGDAYFALDADWRITAVNRAMERNVKLGRDALLGWDLWARFPALVGSPFEPVYRRAMAERVPTHITHDYSDGRLDFVADVDAYPTDDGGIALFWRDVTARLRAETLLRRREAKYRALFTRMEQGFCIVEAIFDDAGRGVDYLFVEANPAFERQTGLTDPVGRTARELVPGLEGHWAETYGRVARTGEAVRFREGAAAMGRVFDVYAFRVGDAAPNRVAILFSDVTAAETAHLDRQRLYAESEQARAALEVARERADRLQRLTEALAAPLTRREALQAIVDQAVSAAGADGGAVMTVEDEGRTLNLLALLGYDADVGEEFRRFPADLNYPARDVLRTGAPVFLEDRAAYDAAGYLPPHGFTDGRATEGWAALPLTADRRPMGVLLLTWAGRRAFDAEERAFAAAFARQCAQALERASLYEAEQASRREAEAARRAAEEANRAKSDFLAVMSHELRTPLNAIGGYADLIALGIHGPVTPEQHRDLERIQRAQRHLLGLINGVLNYARVEAGAVHYDVADVPLDEVLATCEALVAPQVRAKGLTLTYAAAAEGDAAALRVRADRDKVQQVVLNLLSNAVKFTEPGGRVAMEAAPDGDRVLVRVRDTGVGIPADKLGLVFDPFVQVDATLTRTREGTGLGLAISRDLARGMGGDLTAESALGTGSTFTLALPAG